MNYFEEWRSLTEQTYALIWPEAIIVAVVVGVALAYVQRHLGR